MESVKPIAALDPATALLPPETRTAHGVTVLRGVPYVVRQGFRPLALDLWRPTTPDPLPIVVFLHGGGWRTGHRASTSLNHLVPPALEQMALAGFVVASIDYRLSGEAHFPAQTHDVAAALEWLRARASEFGADASRIVLWGESAGGHLASLAALDKGLAPVRGVIAWFPVTDLPTLHEGALPESVADPFAPGSREEKLLGVPLAQAGRLAIDASPLRQVHPDAPPFLLAHGTHDRFVPVRQSLIFAERLEQAGVPVETHIIEGADHMWIDFDDAPGLMQHCITFAHRVTAPER
jgi:acetyl esterase/lipase